MSTHVYFRTLVTQHAFHVYALLNLVVCVTYGRGERSLSTPPTGSDNIIIGLTSTKL